MVGMKKIINSLVYVMLPKGAQNLIGVLLASKISDEHRNVIGNNIKFRNIHSGRRCFILCNGESVATQDLTLLKDEIVFSVSQGYLHKQYETIKPQYHCCPQFTNSAISTGVEGAIRYLKEMETLTGNAAIFLSTNEKKLVENNHIFSNRNVNYLHFYNKEQPRERDELFDISKPVPGVQSVPIMCLMIAMYMGFNNIYLIGTDHDSFQTGYYSYPFDSSWQTGKNYGVTPDGKITSLYDELQAAVTLWQQYRVIKKVAVLNGCKIYNATNGGALDEFERVKLEDVLVLKMGIVKSTTA